MLFPGNPAADPSGVSQEKETHVQLSARVRTDSAAPGVGRADCYYTASVSGNHHT